MSRHGSVGVKVLGVVLVLAAAGAGAAPTWKAPGANLALHKPYTISWSGKTRVYGGAQDDGDKVQLTDGEYAPTGEGMWIRKAAVAWNRGPVAIVIDLGDVSPIGGLSFSTEHAPVPGINWPPAILILVSDDGKDYRVAGELVGLSAKFAPPPGQGRHRFVTDDLQARGRYVQLIVQGSLIVVCDEIEVYQGKRAYLTLPSDGPVIDKPLVHFVDQKMPYAVSARMATDAARAASVVAALDVPKSVRRQSLDRLEALRQEALKTEFRVYDRDFHAVAPLNELHAQVFAALSDAYRAAGYPEYTVWQTNRWLRQTPFQRPPLPAPDSPPVTLRVHMMQNERRGEAVNIGHFGATGTTATVSFSGLPGGSCPDYLDVRQAEYVAMQSRPWDADALTPAGKTDAGWKVTLPAGMSRQLWLDFRLNRGACPAGQHRGEVVVQVDGGPKLAIPLELEVAPFTMAKERAVAAGVWDYTDQAGYGLLKQMMETNGTLEAAVTHMRESGVTAPWAQAGRRGAVFPRAYDNMFDAEGKLTNALDFSAFDAWAKMWPDAKYYMIYANGWGDFGVAPGAEKIDAPGLDETQRRFGVVMKAWADHLRTTGVDPARIAICLNDEPQWSSQARIILYWGRAIKAAVPEFKLYEDTRFKPPYYTNAQVVSMLDLIDIITPGTDYDYQRVGQQAVDFYEQFRQKGKIMGFYACAQNPSEAEATRYYRLQQWACWNINGGGRQSWAGFWSYSDVRGGTPWNQLSGGNDRNWCPAYLDYTSATDGKHWLAIFEGVQDYEYLLMLKDQLEKARQAGRNDEAVTSAQQLLDTLPDEVIAAVRGGDQTACDAGRLRVLDALTALAK